MSFKVTEINEVKLIELLADEITGWVHNFRFTIEKDTDKDVQDEEKNYSPTVYKYYLPKRQDVEPIAPQPPSLRGINNHIPTPKPTPLFPAIVVRPSEGNIDVGEGGTAYEDVSIDIGIFVHEYDVNYRYTSLLLAKKVIMQNLRGITGGIIGSSYILQPNPTWQLKDDSQEPNGLLVITTVWRCFLPRQGKFNLKDI